MAGRIIIVEDDYIIALALRKRLESWGYAICRSSARGDAAIAGIETDLPDLAILDVYLEGEVSGIDVAAHIAGGKLSTRFIFLTASQDAATLKLVRETGPLAILSKPYDEGALRVAVESAFAGR